MTKVQTAASLICKMKKRRERNAKKGVSNLKGFVFGFYPSTKREQKCSLSVTGSTILFAEIRISCFYYPYIFMSVGLCEYQYVQILWCCTFKVDFQSSEKSCSVISHSLSVSFVEKSAKCQLNVLLSEMNEEIYALTAAIAEF